MADRGDDRTPYGMTEANERAYGDNYRDPPAKSPSLSEQAVKEAYMQGNPHLEPQSAERVGATAASPAPPKQDLVATITSALNKRNAPGKHHHRHIAKFDQGSMDSRGPHPETRHKRINTQPEVVYENQLLAPGALPATRSNLGSKPRYAPDSHHSSAQKPAAQSKHSHTQMETLVANYGSQES